MAYKNDNQYTTLIHAGDNVTIDPPGVINAAGSQVVVPETPYEIKHEGETVAVFESDGDLVLDGTLYIDGDTDVKDLTPIYIVDIVGNYTTNTFTSEDGFDDIMEAIDGGFTVIARDSNGFVYQQSNSQSGEDITDTVNFFTVQADGTYILTWTEDSRTIAKAEKSKMHIYEYTNQTHAEVVTWLNAAYAVDGDNGQYILHIKVSNIDVYCVCTFVSTSWRVYGIYADNDGINKTYLSLTSDGNFAIYFTWQQIMINYYTGMPIYYRDGGTGLWYHPSNTQSTYKLTASNLSKIITYTDGTSVRYFRPIPTVIYIENGKHHILTLSEDSGDFTGSSYPKTYEFTGVEASSSTTIVIYKLVVSMTSSSAYTETLTTTTYTIGS